jgi:hypothetical protein
MAKAIDPTVLTMVLSDWRSAPQGNKTMVIFNWAGRLGVSVATLYRDLPRSRERKAERKIEGIEDSARVIAAIKCRPPEHRGKITTEQAVKLALANGQLPAAHAEVHSATWDRVIRDVCDLRTTRRISRFQAERPNQLHHVDGSTSSCFYIAKRLPDGEFVLKLHKGMKDYKNKPIPVDGLRPWVYGLTDDHSGVHVARYVAACGESAGDNMDFLSWAWSKNEDKELFGIPEKIKGDKGPMMSSEGAPEWFGRLGVDIDPSTPLNKESHGKIERPWRTMWQRFELPFFVETDWKKFEITLGELNRRFFIYQQELNNRRHRFERTVNRIDAWRKISLIGGAVALPENAIRTVVRRWARKLDQAGVFSLDNVLYEVKGLHDAWVYVYQGVFENKMVVVDQVTGQKYDVEDFAPNKLGEYSTQKEAPYQKAAKAGALLDGMHNTLYIEKPIASAKVSRIPTRVKAARQMDDPLAVDSYASLGEAMRDFQKLCGFVLDKESREGVGALITDNRLSRRFVADLAGEVQVERERRVTG